ncbi:MAG TPA: hypothetical protein VJ385_07920 [Fibrobacteria bacterium]|nr:hypothetical protein [Fibrobacteria bacterium]
MQDSKRGNQGKAGLPGRSGGMRLAAALALLPLVPSASALEVHEWGTFTTLNASSGNGLSGLFVDATRLPAFVHGLPYFNYDPVSGWSSPDKLRNVTVKMETPVLYFYADKRTDVDVKVKFRGGTISQWYPQCYDCEGNPAAPYVDFAEGPYAGHIGWKATVLPPGSNLPYTTTALGGETPEWTAPRNTQANQLRGQNGEIEKFLFYRGLGNFPSAVALSFLPDGTLCVANRGGEDIPYLMIYDLPPGPFIPAADIRFQGPVKAGQEIKVARDRTNPNDYRTASEAMETFRKALVDAGLTDSESRALLNTWYNGYFIEAGLKAFWIVPRAQVDRILPLEIAPMPDKLVRVIVGRSEILTREFEQELYRARDRDSVEAKYKADKYYLAYRDFLDQDGERHVVTSLGRGTRGAQGTGPQGFAGRSFPGGWASPWFARPGGPVDARGRAIGP